MSDLKVNSIDSLNGVDEVNIPTLDNRMVKAWVNFNGTGTVSIRSSYNVSSVVDNDVGDYTVNYNNAIVGDNSPVVTATDWGSRLSDAGPTSSRILTADASGVNVDSVIVSFHVLSN